MTFILFVLSASIGALAMGAVFLHYFTSAGKVVSHMYVTEKVERVYTQIFFV